MKAYIVDNGSLYLHDLVHLLQRYDPTVVQFGELDPRRIQADSIVILSGGHTIPVLWHNREFGNEINVIANHKGPLIGVCLGAQLIAHAYGSHLHLMDRQRKGLLNIYPVENSGVLPAVMEATVYENHHWSIRELKKPLLALAKSEDGIEVFRHRSRPMYGLQFHPESAEAKDGRMVYEAVLSTLVAEAEIL